MLRDPLPLSRRQLFLLACAAARLAAADEDFWDTKPPGEWSIADIYQLVNRSPWAKPVRGFLRPAPGPPDLAPKRNGKPMPMPVVPQGVVTWESSQPIRDALKTLLPSVFTDCYVIGVDGIPLGTASTDYLLKTAALHSYGKVKWTARPQVVRELIRTSPVCALGFSRATAPIGPDSGEIVFEAEFQRWLVESRFDPRKMLYHGQLAV
jgi:hypothetical protein